MIIAPIIGAFYHPIIYYAIKMMVDTITKSTDLTFAQLTIPLMIYLVSDILLSTAWSMSNILLWKSEPYVQRGILLRALRTTLSYKYTFFQNTASGALVSKIKGLFEGYNELWAQLWYGISFWILASITTVLSIFFVSGILGSIIIIWAVIYMTINYFLAIKVNKLSQLQNDAKHIMIGELSDSLSNAGTVKLFSNRAYEYQRLDEQITNDFIPKEIKAAKFRFKVDIFNDIMAIGMLFGMLLIMIQLKRLNLVTIGDFVFVFGMVFQLQENLFHLMGEFHKLSDRMGDIKSSLSIYNMHESEYQGDSVNYNINNNLIGAGLPSVEFKNIGFTYNENKTIFSGLNLILQPGERIGIVGFTGAGKTTLINLLLKIFTPQYGQILINNNDIANMDCDFLRQYIGVIPQDTTLFHRNIMENIRYGRLSATDDEVIASAIKAHANEFIQELPHGYQTLVGERGVKLSGGQRQRIAIARAILKNAPILILDEATSSLDSITEQYIQDGMQELLNGKTVLAIAHRLSTLLTMDRLIVINNGAIEESGTHDELLVKPNSLYAKIWHTQYSEVN